VNDPHPDVGAAAFTGSHDPGCEDAGLLRRIGQGDEDAMAAFYREHGRVVFAQVLLVAGERVLAEEIVQDTMVAVWPGAGSFRGESSVRSWVDRTCAHSPAMPPGLLFYLLWLLISFDVFLASGGTETELAESAIAANEQRMPRGNLLYGFKAAPAGPLGCHSPQE
jgi:Sigma-70 region 2